MNNFCFTYEPNNLFRSLANLLQKSEFLNSILGWNCALSRPEADLSLCYVLILEDVLSHAVAPTSLMFFLVSLK